MRELEVSKIILTDTRRWINSVVKKTDFICYDVETYKGKCKLLCNSENEFIYNPTFLECLDFLFLHSKKNHFRAFFNIDFDISSILKLWNDISSIDKLIHGKIVYYDIYSMYYIRPKMFMLAKGVEVMNFKEISEKKQFKIEKNNQEKKIYIVDLFSMFKKSLNKASKEFLNDEKLDIIDASKLNTDIKYWIDNLDDIIEYCMKDAKLTARLGNKLIDEIIQCNLLLPKFFTSHASLAKQYFRYNCRIPSLKYIPTNILDIGFRTYYGGRFEVLKRGYFDNLYDYDINSAYPKTISELPSFKYGNWKVVKEINHKECIGFYEVLFSIPEQYISPFPLRLKNRLIVFPSGIFGTWITWYEADLLRDYIIKVSNGYEYFPSRKEYKPFKLAIETLYQEKLRNKYTNEIFYWLVKLTMNSLYGCFIEKHRKIDGKIYSGVLFNPIYASIITAKTRWKLLKDVGVENYDKIVAFHTDSVILTDTKGLNLKIDDKMGNWSKEASGKGVILKTGVYQIGNIVKRRGIGLKGINWLDKLNEFLDYDIIEIDKSRVIKIAEALKRWKSIDMVNTWIEKGSEFYKPKKININTEYKRNWNSNFKNCRDLLSKNISSKTLHLSYINDKNLF